MHKIFTQILQYLNRSFSTLGKLKVRIAFAVGMFIFSLLFLILFIPFNITEWIVYTSPFKALQIPGLAVIVGVIIFISQMLQYLLFRKKELKNYHVILSFVLDVIFISIPLSLLYSIPANSFWIEFRETLAIVTPLAFLCYVLGITFMILCSGYKHRQGSSHDFNAKAPIVVERINIKDSNGQIRLSLRPEDLLYFESADNYILVHFRKKHQLGRELIRNSLKNIETEHQEQCCIRCHRSYIVNLANVSTIRKRGRAYEIAIEGVDVPISFSRGYVKNVKDMLESP